MKRHYLFLFITAFLMIISSACSKQCPDFNNGIIIWMPYQSNDKILLTDNIHIDTLTVKYSEVYHVSKTGFGTDCSCENSFILNLWSDSLTIDVRFNDSRLIAQSEIIINDEWMNYSRHLADSVINGQLFSDLIIYENNNQTFTRKFKKIIISKSIGIIVINGLNTDWKVPDILIRSLEISDIEFKGTDC